MIPGARLETEAVEVQFLQEGDKLLEDIVLVLMG